jgi:iron complex outermembrane receptor protein
MRFQRRKVAIALGVGSVALVAGGSVSAQDIRVNVTGTNIKRVDSETAAPIETITREDIQQSGLNTISDVVRRITANSNGTVGDSFTNGFAGGGATAVSLRGLGSNNTLVLVNGRRLANTGLADDGQYSFVDLNQIPFDLVERIEVLKDGASAIYGSDAVAGVVNVILRQQFTGVTVTGTGGINYQGDGGMLKGAVTAGIGDLTRDRFNAYISVDAMKQDSVPLTSLRDYMGTSDLRYMGLPDTRNGAPPSGFGTGSLVGSVRPVNPATGGTVAGGAYTTLPGCDPANQDSTLGPATNPFCRFEQKQYLDLIPESDRFNIFGRAQYNINDNLSLYGEASYFQFKSDNRNTPSQPRSTWPNVAGSTVNNSTNIFLPVGHPDNPFNAQGYGARLYYAAGDIGGRNSHIENTVQRYLGGLKGSNFGWDWDAGILYIKNETDQTRYGFFNYANLQQALNGQGGFGYYRIGQNASLNNPGIYDFIAPAISNNVTSENTQFDAKASRDIYKMDGGQMALAVGYEYRREELNNPGTTGTFTGNIVGLGYSAATASRNINALFAELYMPVLKNLEITAAIRYDDYSDFGSTWNPKIGVKWTVVPQLVARGTYATAFRAPGPYENGNSAAAGFTSINDPVRCPITNNAADCQGTVVAITSGNPQIKPETSTNWTVGLIWEPVPSFNASVDYWNIETKDKITGADPQAVVDNPSGFPAATIVRGDDNLPGIPNSGTLFAVSAPYENADTVKTDGIDVAATWRLPLQDWGRLTTTLEWTHILNFKRTIGGITYQYAGTHGPTSLSSSAGMPQDRANLVIAWDRGPWNVAGTIRYVGPMDNIESEQQPDCLTFADNGYCTVASFTTLDLAASYKGFKNWEIFGSVINVFNAKAPFDRQAGYGSYNFNYNYAFSGAMGTQFNLGARYTFQ